MTPNEVDRIARKHTRGRFAVCAIHGSDEPDAPLRTGFKDLGYRLRTTKSMVVHPLKRIPRCAGLARIQRVRTMDMVGHRPSPTPQPPAPPGGIPGM